MSLSSSNPSYYREQRHLTEFTLGRFTEKHNWPDSRAQLASLSRASSRGYGSTLQREAPPAPQYRQGVRTKLCRDELDVPEFEDRLFSRDPRYLRSLKNDFEYSASSNAFASTYAASGVASALVFSFRNKTLELRSPMTYAQLSKTYVTDRDRFHRYCLLTERNLGKWWLEACMMGYYVSQHHILILYEYEDKQRKIHALRSYFGDSYGQDESPVGDILMFPRKPPKKDNIILECLGDICRTIQKIHHLQGTYRSKVVPRLSSEEGFMVRKVTNAFKTQPELRVSRQFKPVFLPIYFEIEDKDHRHPKTVMALKMLEKCCLAFEHICEAALLWRNTGKACAAAQAAKICTKYIDLLLGTTLLSDYLAHTHLLAEWQMGNALFLLICGMGDTDQEIQDYRLFDRTTNFVPNFMSALEDFKKYFPRETFQIQNECPWTFPGDIRVCLDSGVLALRRCRLPASWLRSHFRLFYMATLKQLSDLREWACSVAPYSRRCRYDRLTRYLDNVINEAQAARNDIPTAAQESGDGEPWEVLRDAVVLQRLVTARALRHKFMLLTAWKKDEVPEGVEGASGIATTSASESNMWDFYVRAEDRDHRSLDVYHLNFPTSPAQTRALEQAEEEQRKVLALLRSPSTHVTKYWHRVHNRALVAQAFDMFTLQLDCLHRSKINAVEKIMEIVQSLGHLCAAGDITPPKVERNHWGLYWEKHDTVCTVIALHCSALARVYLYCSKRELASASSDATAVSNASLRVGRYFQHVAALCQGRPAVALHLLHRHCAALQVARACYLNDGRHTVKHACRLMHLLRLVVDMLPFLWDEAVAEAEKGPSDCPFFCIKEKVLPFTPREMRNFSSPCVEGLQHALATMSTLPNVPKSGALPVEQELKKDEKATATVCEAALQAALNDTKFKELDTTLMECIEKLCAGCVDKPRISAAGDSAALVFAHLCGEIKQIGMRLKQSAVKIAVTIFSIAVGVIGTLSFAKLTPKTPEQIINKVKDIMQSVGEYLDEPSIEDVEGGAGGQASDRHSGDSNGRFEEIVENLRDFDNFLKWVGNNRSARRFSRAQNPNEIALHIERILRDLLHQIVAIFGSSDTFYYYLAADSFLNFICMLDVHFRNENVLSVVNSLSKVFILSMKNAIERKLETNDWCASPEEVHTHPLLREDVLRPKNDEKFSQPEEIVEKNPLAEKAKVPSDGLQLSYDPYEHLPAHLEEEEAQCLRFEQFSMLRSFHEITGAFTCREQTEYPGLVLSEIRCLLLSTFDDAVIDFEAIMEMRKSDLVFIDVHGEVFKITASALESLAEVKTLLEEEYPKNFIYVLAKCVYSLDQLFFNGSVRGLLRGSSDERAPQAEAFGSEPRLNDDVELIF